MTRGYVTVFVGLAAQNLLLFGLSLLLASIYGTDAEVDAYAGNALSVPLLFSGVLAGTFAPTLIPVLQGSDPEENKRSLAGLAIGGTLLFSLVLAVLGAIFARPVMMYAHPGGDPDLIARSTELFRILVWLIPANTMIGLFQSVLNAHLNFLTPALAGVLGPLLTVLIVALFAEQGEIEVVAWATVLGAVFSVLWQLPRVRKYVAFRNALQQSDRLRSLLGLAGPIFLGILFVRMDAIVDRQACSTLPEGRIAQLRYASQIMTIFVAFASGTLSTVAFPRIARAIDDRKELVARVREGLRTLITLTMPGFVVLFLFATPLVRDLFERGEFTSADTAIVATLVQIYAFYFLGACLGELSTKTMFALHDSVTPTVIGSVGLAIGFGFKLWLAPRLGIDALVTISSTTYVVISLLLLFAACGKTGYSVFTGLGVTVLKSLAATLLAMLIGWGMLQTGLPLSGILGLLLGAGAYFAAVWGMGRRERAAE